MGTTGSGVATVAAPDAVTRPSSWSRLRLDRNSVFALLSLTAASVWLWHSFGLISAVPPTATNIALGILVLLLFLAAPRETWRMVPISITVLLLILDWSLTWFYTNNKGAWIGVMKVDLVLLIVAVAVMSVVPLERLRQVGLGCFIAIVGFTFMTLAIDPSTLSNPDPVFGGVVSGWRGPFIHKNIMGSFMVFGYFTTCIFGNKWLRIALFPPVAILVVMCESTTVLLLAIVVTGMFFWLGGLRRVEPRAKLVYPATTSAAAFIGLLLWEKYSDLLFRAVGKDPSLTGRTKIWEQVWLAIDKHPWIGWAPGSVWVDQSRTPTREIREALGFVIFHAHSGYLEYLLNFGRIGLAIYALMAIALFRDARRLMDYDLNAGRWGICVLVMLLVMSIGELGTTSSWLAITLMVRLVMQRLLIQHRGPTGSTVKASRAPRTDRQLLTSGHGH